MLPPQKDDPPALDRLLHDVRTPLGVAHGYLRMVRDGRLNAPEQRDKALTGVTRALAQITLLCDDAAGRAPSGLAAEPDRAASTVAESLAARLGGLGITCRLDGDDAPAALRATDTDAVIDAASLLIRGLLDDHDLCVVRTDAAASAIVVCRSSGAVDTPLLILPLENVRS